MRQEIINFFRHKTLYNGNVPTYFRPFFSNYKRLRVFSAYVLLCSRILMQGVNLHEVNGLTPSGSAIQNPAKERNKEWEGKELKKRNHGHCLAGAGLVGVGVGVGILLRSGVWPFEESGKLNDVSQPSDQPPAHPSRRRSATKTSPRLPIPCLRSRRLLGVPPVPSCHPLPWSLWSSPYLDPLRPQSDCLGGELSVSLFFSCNL